METALSFFIDFAVHAGLFVAGILTAYYVSVRYC
jgi:hypothetical protein